MTPPPDRPAATTSRENVAKLVDALIDCVPLVRNTGSRYEATSPGIVAMEKARARLDAALASLADDAERYSELRRLVFEDMRSVEEMRTFAPRTFDALVDKFIADASRSPIGETPEDPT